MVEVGKTLSPEHVSLTGDMSITNGAHILYCYNSSSDYINNAASYIQTGIELGHRVIFIEGHERYRSLVDVLTHRRVSVENVMYVASEEFYMTHGSFIFDRIVRNFTDLIQPLLDQNVTFRVWSHPKWRDQEDITSKLVEYESACQRVFSNLGIIGVCAFDANTVSASLQNALLEHHEYFMTDRKLVKSLLYNSDDRAVIPPSLSAMAQLRHEMDLYRQKLDFVHAVSHEVRNPLTVIKAYATIILERTLDPDTMQKMKSIRDYVDVIDHEIANIINTEQMLGTDSFWHIETINPLTSIRNVISMMEKKASTQNIKLQYTDRLLDSFVIQANSVGLELIVSNLISNAIKYSAEGATVDVDVFTFEGNLVIRVADHGIGMSEGQMYRLFSKYEKMNWDKGGQGIGLYVVKHLIDHFSGRIEFYSKLGVGTEVFVTLSLSP